MVKVTILIASLSALAVAFPAPERLEARQSCQGQSCLIADTSRSTGRKPPSMTGPDAPKGGNAAGNRCIIDALTQLNRECRIPVGSRVQTDGVALPVAPGCEGSSGASSSSQGSSGGFDDFSSGSTGGTGGGLSGGLGGLSGGLGGLGGGLGGLSGGLGGLSGGLGGLSGGLGGLSGGGLGSLFGGGLFGKREEAEIEKRQLFGGGSGGCTPFRVIYAKGTTERGEFGSTVGPALRSGLAGRDFTVNGVEYPADMAGINCIGLPGGIIATRQLEQAVAQCPGQKIFMSGYSQGAMVAREAVAFARPEARKQVIGVVTFGDPFNGAPIADFDSSRIKIYCTGTDGVCKGELSITLGHLVYVGTYTSNAVRWIQQTARASG